MTTPSRFPVGPLVDLTTGLITLEWFMWFQNPEVQSIIFATPVDVASGGTGLSSGTSGGILGFTATTTIESSVELTQFELVIGGGAGATPIPLGDPGTTSTILHGNAAGLPTWGSVVLSSEVSGILPIANGGTNSATPLDGAAIIISNGSAIVQGPKGIDTRVLHGNASGVPQYLPVIEDDQQLADVTTLNSSTTKHGYLKKLSGNATDFLNGDGDWVAPEIGSWVPTVDGSEPPVFITDGAGVLIFAPFSP